MSPRQPRQAPAAAGTGHPAHQIREFIVDYRNGGGAPRYLRVYAQTERDAAFRAGMVIASQQVIRVDDVHAWIVIGVRDPVRG